MGRFLGRQVLSVLWCGRDPNIRSRGKSICLCPFSWPFYVSWPAKILVCRTPEEKNIQVLLSIQDEEVSWFPRFSWDDHVLIILQDGNENYACAWSKDLETGTPILCVAGSSGKIKVINALTGELLRVGYTWSRDFITDNSRCSQDMEEWVHPISITSTRLMYIGYQFSWGITCEPSYSSLRICRLHSEDMDSWPYT